MSRLTVILLLLAFFSTLCQSFRPTYSKVRFPLKTNKYISPLIDAQAESGAPNEGSASAAQSTFETSSASTTDDAKELDLQGELVNFYILRRTTKR